MRRPFSPGSYPRSTAFAFCDSAALAPDLGSGESIADQLFWGHCMQSVRSITKEDYFVLFQLLTASDLAASDLKGFQPQVSSTDPFMNCEQTKLAPGHKPPTLDFQLL